MNYIELFADVGPITWLRTAGFDLLFANELSPMASETFSHNPLGVDLENAPNRDKILWSVVSMVEKI